MKQFPLFLNEISCFIENVSEPDRRSTVINAIKTIIAAKKIRDDLIFITNNNLNQIVFNSSEICISLSALLGGGEYAEEWSFLKRIVQISPFEVCPVECHPLENEEISHLSIPSIGLTWAWKNASFVISFSTSPAWTVNMIDAELTTMDQVISLTENVQIKNIHSISNVLNWKNEILYFGADFSSSSLVHECGDFAARMFLRDHNPPHIHVYKNASSQDVIARFNIRHLEFLETKSSTIRASLLAWARPRQAQLLESWERCQGGQLPFRCN